MPRVIDSVVDTIIDAGIDYVFGLPGGVSGFILEEFYKRSDQINTIIARHENSASIMADMYGRMTRKPGILLGQGPFIATNGGLGIIEAFHAGVPMVILTETSDYHGNSLQACYQSGTGEYGTVDIRNIFKSMTKYTAYPTEPEEVPYAVQLAIKHATSGRPGPACVFTRWNVWTNVIDDLSSLEVPIYPIEGHLRVTPPCISDLDAQKIANLLIAADNPVMICGRGVHASAAYDEVLQLAEMIGMPVATSYMGKGSIPEVHDLALGVMASFGQQLADDMIKNADVILAVGTCLAPDNTNNCSPEFIDVKWQKIIHIDIEPRNAGWTYPVTIGVTSDAKLALQKIIHAISSKMEYFKVDVNQRISDLLELKKIEEKEFFTSKKYDSEETPVQPESVVRVLNELTDEDDLLVLDAGNNRMWFTRLFKTQYAGQIYGAGGVAAMGWGPNASLIAQMLNKDKKVISIAGDGSFAMMIYVLQTAKQYDLPISYMIFNDGHLGNIRDVLSRKGRDLSIIPGLNFAEIAKGMGVEGVRVENYDELYPKLEESLKSDHTTLTDILIDQKASHLRIRRS
ncbi:MAG: thiamine pyrophosphate-binding protein [Promethearchaeota archaeon]|nr:MAG: thiamine pyrophosphate-binding protein [Candidatus Lokiarchaeota archaeon]